MAVAKKQKSGKWMCQVFTGYTYKDGKRKREYKAFTAATPFIFLTGWIRSIA